MCFLLRFLLSKTVWNNFLQSNNMILSNETKYKIQLNNILLGENSNV